MVREAWTDRLHSIQRSMATIDPSISTDSRKVLPIQEKNGDGKLIVGDLPRPPVIMMGLRV